MPNENSDYLAPASEYWRDGNPLEAGRLIFENLPARVRPKWASKILKSLVVKTGIKSPPIEHILQIANDPNEWSKAHDAFSSARVLVLGFERSRNKRTAEQTLLLGLLGMAELVAKVTYNATDPIDEFDEDSGWWIAVGLKHILVLLNDQEFSDSMWSAFCSKEGE